MEKLSREDLMSLEEYAQKRAEFRPQVMAHKRNRRLALGAHAALYFEDRLTMQYQVQEMLRAERIFEAAGIEEELDTYNPLIPDGSNWKATFMLEYDDVEQRQEAVQRLIGIEDKVWVRVAGFDKIYAIADEDLERETEEKTSTVHFMRFELSAEMVAALKQDATLSAGIEHENMPLAVEPVPAEVVQSLVGDLD
ncbi:MAG: DUF3501 family protein [Acidihalobacter sp.]|uniref:DUF3501 family protein n=1 Tax=Acidihalobacter sp. TaxID=1872108 RepID=UPI00307E28E1